MSKIALKANDSGTGTFEIQAPATNTNRVLELPDEAGKVLTTGNSDPAEVFKQSNILGTVSQSGGVPTGAIIERGSNANGEFVRYADGTQIARTNGVTSTPGLAGNQTKNLTVNPPVTFIGGFGIAAGFSNFRVNSSGTGFPVAVSRTFETGVRVFRITNLTGSNMDTDTVIDLTLIGRWF